MKVGSMAKISMNAHGVTVIAQDSVGDTSKVGDIEMAIGTKRKIDRLRKAPAAGGHEDVKKCAGRTIVSQNIVCPSATDI